MIKRSILNSPRLEELDKRKRKIFTYKVVFLGITTLAALTGLVYLSRLNKLNISVIEVEGNSVTDGELIRETAESVLAGNYLWVFPKTNIFFYPKSRIKNELAHKFTRLKDIELEVKNERMLHISLSERKALYAWCGEDLSVLDTKCYFLDDIGYVFDEAPYFTGEVYFKFYGVLDGEEIAPSGSYFSKNNFDKIIKLKQTLESMTLKPVALFKTIDGDMKVYLSRGKSGPFSPEIIFKTDADLEKIAENLQVALTTEPLQTDFKTKYSSLQYIDLRFGNKVYFKFR